MSLTEHFNFFKRLFSPINFFFLELNCLKEDNIDQTLQIELVIYDTNARNLNTD